MGIPGLLWLGARRTGHGALNALARPAWRSAVATMLLAYSRGALLAAAIGVALWFAVVPLRLRGVAVLAARRVGRRWRRVLGLRAARAERRPRRAGDRASPPGYELGIALAVVLLVVLVASLAVGFAVAERPPSIATRRQAGAVVLIAARARAGRPGRGARAVRPRASAARSPTPGGR